MRVIRHRSVYFLFFQNGSVIGRRPHYFISSFPTPCLRELPFLRADAVRQTSSFVVVSSLPRIVLPPPTAPAEEFAEFEDDGVVAVGRAEGDVVDAVLSEGLLQGGGSLGGGLAEGVADGGRGGVEEDDVACLGVLNFHEAGVDEFGLARVGN